MNAICLIVDRLHAGFVGAYGNSWIETPALDRLAGQSLTLDCALVDTPHLERLYRSYWQGWHAMCPAAPFSRPSLAATLRAAGVRTALLTDEPQVAKHPLAGDFDQLVELDPPWQAEAAEEIEQTHFARCFVRLIDWLESARGPFALWCHFAGLGTAWDAPQRFRQAYCEPGDPPPPVSADVPELVLPTDCDPDEALGIAQAYAGQVTLFDACLGGFLEFLDGQFARRGRQTLLAVAAARGFPLGEHRRVGQCDGALCGELVHTPWMLRFPDAAAASARSRSLVEPADMWATLIDFFNAGPAPHSPTALSLLPIVRQESDCLRDRLCVLGDGPQRAIRTPAWHLCTVGEPGSEAEPVPKLFAKPDDRWEVNDVASRCPEVVECLQDAMLQYELTLPSGRASELPPLGDVLLHGLD